MSLMSLTAVALGKKIQAGEVTVEEAVLDALEQIEKKEDAIHSYVTVLEKEAILEKAKETHNDIPKQNAPVDNTETAPHKKIVIDDDIDKTHPINTILAKVDNHEQLTPEELEQYKNHVAKAIPSIRQSLESFAETLKQSLAEYYEAMNDEGQKEADLQIQKTIEKVTKQAENQAIDEATEKVQLLSRIPEYKKDSDA